MDGTGNLFSVLIGRNIALPKGRLKRLLWGFVVPR